MPEIFEESPLQELDLSGNNLPLAQLNVLLKTKKLQQTLQRLYLSGMQLTDVPAISAESPLQELDLSGNNLLLAQLNVLLKTKKLQQTLQRLYLSDMQLTDVPEFLQESLLEELDLSNNQLTSLPESLGSLKNLNWINLAGNSLTSLPMSFQGLLNNEMTIEGVPEENIQRLIQNAWQQFFTDKNAEQLWNTLKSATSIIALNLSGIDEELRQEVLDKAIEYLVLYKDTLQKLDLSNNQLTSLHKSLGSLPNLKWINLSGNDALLGNLATPEYQPQLDLLRRLKNRGVDIEGLSGHINECLSNTETPPTVSSAEQQGIVATPSATASQAATSDLASQTQASSGT